MGNQPGANLSVISAALILKKNKFEVVHKSNLIQNIRAVKPSGGTALRDAILIGSKLVLDTASELIEIGIGQLYNFIHVVITDGEDTSSKTTFDQLLAINMLTGKIVPQQMLSTFYVGVDLDQNTSSSQEFMKLSSMADNSQYYCASNNEIAEIFNRIELQMGIKSTPFMSAVTSGDQTVLFGGSQRDLVMNVKKCNYIVLFTLDISGSMAGNKWQTLTSCLEKFMTRLYNQNPQSFVNCLLFNDKIVPAEQNNGDEDDDY